ncbi:hypothetical protein PR370_07330 [Mycobacterium marinum]|uniref:hypothetical protein n=1 Tax=Mycobacterium marinum TaxID=1781 RepID=UPI000E3DCF93|nr:hypothetical protein [Mycobacterium marinum]MDC8980972.1 hypothetical protein [Mycobacterium marinum]MDC8999282.1 hypothetical protein [Mycobacterium marinum]MDC9009853.1 hypothetical protein [Mycobacterium marinum]RFZ49355.1 hypothetical protein MSS2_04252 [Mycobacterium marinum]
MYLQSRSKRWLGVVRKSLTILQMAERSVAAYAEAATRMQGVRVISERDQDIMTILARDPIALTLESQRPSGDSELAATLEPISAAMSDFSVGDGFADSLRALIAAVESATPLLEQRTTEPDDSLEEIIAELERAFLISMVMTLTSHHVLVKKVEDWEGPHGRFLQGHLPADVGHYFDVKTLAFVDAGGPGRVHMQDLVFAIDSGATIFMAGAGQGNVDNYPEAQAVAYAEWFSYAYSLWEHQFRGRIAAYFDRQSSARIRRSDVLHDFFGDIRLIRNDFVHNKGICKESAKLNALDWGLIRGRPIEVTPEQMLSLIDLFPRDALRISPTPQPPGETVRVPGKIDSHLLEDAQRRAQEIGLTDNQLLDAALSSWLIRNTV